MRDRETVTCGFSGVPKRGRWNERAFKVSRKLRKRGRRETTEEGDSDSKGK